MAELQSNKIQVIALVDAAWAALKLALLEGGRDLTDAEMAALRLLIGTHVTPNKPATGPGVGIEDAGSGRKPGDRRG